MKAVSVRSRPVLSGTRKNGSPNGNLCPLFISTHSIWYVGGPNEPHIRVLRYPTTCTGYSYILQRTRSIMVHIDTKTSKCALSAHSLLFCCRRIVRQWRVAHMQHYEVVHVSCDLSVVLWWRVSSAWKFGAYLLWLFRCCETGKRSAQTTTDEVYTRNVQLGGMYLRVQLVLEVLLV